MRRRHFSQTIKIAAVCVAAATVTAPPATATFPGEANGRIVFAGMHGGAYGIFTMQPDGSDVKHIVSNHATSPSVAPHGGQVVFSSPDGIGLAGIDGKGFTILAPSKWEFYPADPSWSPDGTKILFSAYVNDPYSYAGNSEIFMVDVDGTDLTRVTNTPGIYESEPAWSPDGKRIAFVRTTSRPANSGSPSDGQPVYLNQDIYTMKPDGSDRLRVTEGGYNLSPDWAPDSSRIVFSRGHNSDAVLAAIDPDGTDFKDLGHHGQDPVFSPDGKQIAFGRTYPYPAWTFGIAVIPAAGGDLQNLTPASTVASAPSWQPIENVEYTEPSPGPPPPVAGQPGPPAQPKPGLDVAAAHRAFVSTAVGNAFRRLQSAGLRGLLRGLTIAETVPAAGGLRLDVLGRAPGATAAAARPTLLATGRATAGKAGPVKLKVKTTKRGRKVVKKAKKMKVWVRVVYTPKGLAKTTSKAKPLVLKRKR
jgi:TolB protein